MTNRFKSASESGRSRPLIVALDQYLFAYFVRLSPNGEDVRLETDCHSTGRCRCGTEHIRSGGISYVGVPLSPRRLCLARRERQPPDAARADPLAAVGKPERLTWLADAAVASLEVNASWRCLWNTKPLAFVQRGCTTQCHNHLIGSSHCVGREGS
jgi:hypothetical protein